MIKTQSINHKQVTKVYVALINVYILLIIIQIYVLSNAMMHHI